MKNNFLKSNTFVLQEARLRASVAMQGSLQKTGGDKKGESITIDARACKL